MTNEIDAFGVRKEISSIKSAYAESCLKSISESMDTVLLAKISQELNGRVKLFLQSLGKEVEGLKVVLGKYKVFRQYSKPPSNFRDECERLSFILPKPNEMDEMENSKGSMRAWLVGRVMMKGQFIVVISNILLKEITKIPRNTGKEYHYVKGGDLTITEFKLLSIFEEIQDMITVLEHSVAEYLDIKANLYKVLGLFSEYRPSQVFPTHWELELRRTQIAILRADDSAIYHVRTALELMLQITLRYFDDKVLAKHARLVSTIRVAEACKEVGIRLPISRGLIERISHYSNLSLHRGQRIPLSDAWHMLSVLIETSEQMKKLKIPPERLSSLREELKSELELK